MLCGNGGQSSTCTMAFFGHALASFAVEGRTGGSVGVHTIEVQPVSNTVQ